jgi:hypothetical protein
MIKHRFTCPLSYLLSVTRLEKLEDVSIVYFSLSSSYSLWILAEHRASATLPQRSRFGAAFSSCPQVSPHVFISPSQDLLQVVFGRPTRLLPWGFQSSAWRVMSPDGFLSVWPIHLHFLLPICWVIGPWFGLGLGLLAAKVLVADLVWLSDVEDVAQATVDWSAFWWIRCW